MENADYSYGGNAKGEINGLLRMGLKFKHKLIKFQVTASNMWNPWKEQHVFIRREIELTGEIKYTQSITSAVSFITNILPVHFI